MNLTVPYEVFSMEFWAYLATRDVQIFVRVGVVLMRREFGSTAAAVDTSSSESTASIVAIVAATALTLGLEVALAFFAAIASAAVRVL